MVVNYHSKQRRTKANNTTQILQEYHKMLPQNPQNTKNYTKTTEQTKNSQIKIQQNNTHNTKYKNTRIQECRSCNKTTQ